MIDAHTLWNLDPFLARVVRDFILQPSSGVHVERLAAVWPGSAAIAPLRPTGDEALSRALMKMLELDQQVPLDLHDPLHRCALMPTEGLACVARVLEVRILAPRLRRVILRSELARLEDVMGVEDWSLALDETGSNAPGLKPVWLEDLPVEELVGVFDRLGWALLELALNQLPGAVSRRAVLKLAVRTMPDLGLEISADHARALVQEAYPLGAARWSERWEVSWNDGWLSQRAA